MCIRDRYQLAEHPNFGDTFMGRGEEMFLARLGLEPAAECSLFKVGFHTCIHTNRGVEEVLVSILRAASLLCD